MSPFPMQVDHRDFIETVDEQFRTLFDVPITLTKVSHSQAVLSEEKWCYQYRFSAVTEQHGECMPTAPSGDGTRPPLDATPSTRGTEMLHSTRSITPMKSPCTIKEATHLLALGTEFIPCFALCDDYFDVHKYEGKKLITGLKDVEKVNVVIIPSFKQTQNVSKLLKSTLKNPKEEDLVIFTVRESEFISYAEKINKLATAVAKQMACFSLPPGQYGPGHCKYWSVEIAKKFSLGWFALMDDSVSTIKVWGSTVKEGSTSKVETIEVSVFQALALIKDARPLATEDSKEKVVCVGGIAGHEKHLQLNFTHARVNQLLFLNGTILKSKQIVFSPLAPLMEDMLFQYKCVAIGLYVLKANWLLFCAGRGETTGGMRETTGGMHFANTHIRKDTPSHQDTTPTRQVHSIGIWIVSAKRDPMHTL